MLESTQPDVLQAKLYESGRQNELAYAKDEEIMQSVADDLFVLSDKFESPNAKSVIRTLAQKLQSMKRELVRGGSPVPMGSPPPGGPMMGPPGMGQAGMAPTDGQPPMM